MSFFKVLCALLKASPAKLVFPDEAKAKEAFLAKYGEEGDQQNLGVIDVSEVRSSSLEIKQRTFVT